MTKTRIVVVGAGFGGMAAVRSLKRADAEVTLIEPTIGERFSRLASAPNRNASTTPAAMVKSSGVA